MAGKFSLTIIIAVACVMSFETASCCRSFFCNKWQRKYERFCTGTEPVPVPLPRPIPSSQLYNYESAARPVPHAYSLPAPVSYHRPAPPMYRLPIPQPIQYNQAHDTQEEPEPFVQSGYCTCPPRYRGHTRSHTAYDC